MSAPNPRPLHRFKAPPGLEIQSFVIRELGSRDETLAALNADVHFPDARDTDTARNGALGHELTMIAIAQITWLDGTSRIYTPEDPCDEDFGSKTRAFIRHKFEKVNFLKKEELDFGGGGELVDEASLAPGASGASIAKLTRG